MRDRQHRRECRRESIQQRQFKPHLDVHRLHGLGDEIGKWNLGESFVQILVPFQLGRSAESQVTDNGIGCVTLENLQEIRTVLLSLQRFHERVVEILNCSKLVTDVDQHGLCPGSLGGCELSPFVTVVLPDQFSQSYYPAKMWSETLRAFASETTNVLQTPTISKGSEEAVPILLHRSETLVC